MCPFTIDIAADSPFTGLFKPGQISGLIRLGAAADFTIPFSPGLVPGVGVKFLRSGTSAANFVALNSLEAIPGGNFNFFAVPLSNHIPDSINDPATAVLAQRFRIFLIHSIQ